MILLLAQRGYYSLTLEQIKGIANVSMWEKDTVERYKIKLKTRTVNYHLQKLIDAGIVERLRDGRKISYRLVDDIKVLYLLDRYKDTFDDFLVYDTLIGFNSKIFNKRFNKMVDNIKDSVEDVFPLPFFV
jgi:DNA-binding transcriptional ArsR family regulator